MSIFDWFDAPRFCPDCGEPVIVENQPEYDGRTGSARDRWLWRCPRANVTLHSGGAHAETHGDYFVHSWGRGRPRWHRAAPTVAA